MTTDERRARLTGEIEALEEERRQLEAAWPAHGVKPGHLQRIEELEERIEEKKAELSGRSSD